MRFLIQFLGRARVEPEIKKSWIMKRMTYNYIAFASSAHMSVRLCAFIHCVECVSSVLHGTRPPASNSAFLLSYFSHFCFVCLALCAFDASVAVCTLKIITIIFHAFVWGPTVNSRLRNLFNVTRRTCVEPFHCIFSLSLCDTVEEEEQCRANAMTTTKRLNAFVMLRMSFSGLFLFIYFNYAQFCVQRTNTIRRSYLDASNYTHRRIHTKRKQRVCIGLQNSFASRHETSSEC